MKRGNEYQISEGIRTQLLQLYSLIPNMVTGVEFVLISISYWSSQPSMNYISTIVIIVIIRIIGTLPVF